MDDVIEIRALRLRCRIGYTDHERRDLSDVVIDLDISTDARPAGDSDQLEQAWNYRTPAKAIIAKVQNGEFHTVEYLATRIARLLVQDHTAPWARVRVTKPGALRFADTVGISLERTPADFSGQVVA